MRISTTIVLILINLCASGQVAFQSNFPDLFEIIEKGTLPFFSLLPTSMNPACSNFLEAEPLPQSFASYGYSGGMSFGFTEEWEKAQYISFDPGEPYFITEVYVYFSHAIVVGNGDISVKIFARDPNNLGPSGVSIGESSPIQVSEIQIDPQAPKATTFSFPTPVVIDDPGFFISVDFSSLYNSRDTVSVYTTSDEGNCTLSNDNWTWRLFLNTDELLWQNMDILYDFSTDLAMGVLVSTDERCTCLLEFPFEEEVLDPSCGLSNGRVGFKIPSSSPGNTDILTYTYEWSNGSSSIQVEGLSPEAILSI